MLLQREVAAVLVVSTIRMLPTTLDGRMVYWAVNENRCVSDVVLYYIDFIQVIFCNLVRLVGSK